MIRRLIAVLAAVFAISAAASAPALAQYPGTTGSGSVSSSTVTAGGTVTFSGSGFAPGSPVVIEVNGQYYTTVTASGSGDFSVVVKLTKVGQNTLVGRGVDALGAARTVTATVTVAAAAAGGLPFTGSNVIVPGALVGLALIVGGGMVLAASRKRRAAITA